MGTAKDERTASRVKTERVALNPLGWYNTVEGPQPELAPPLGEIYRQVREAGFSAVHIEPPDDLALTEYAALLSRSGLRPAPGYFHAPFSQTDQLAEVLDRARRSAANHAQLGLDRVFIADQFADAARLVSPAQGAGHDPARLGTVIENLGAAAQAMVSEGVMPCLHQHVGTLIETPDEVERVLDEIEPSLLLFGPDTGHLAWAGADPAHIIRRHASRVGAVHLKDVHLEVARSGREKGEGYWEVAGHHLWTEPGRGDVNFDTVLDALKGFDGWFVIEVDIAEQPTPAESAEVCWQWCQKRLVVTPGA